VAQPWSVAMEAITFSRRICDHPKPLRWHMRDVTGHCGGGKKYRGDADNIGDCLRCDFLPERMLRRPASLEIRH